MSKESPTNSPSEDKKESYLYATSGQPCVQDTNPAAMPTDKIDSNPRRVPSCDSKEDGVPSISQDNIMPGSEQQDYNERPPSQTERTIDIQEHHTQPFSIPRDNQQEAGYSDIKGQPVVVGAPNAEEVERQYLQLSSSLSTSTDISSVLEISAGSSQLSGSQPSFCKY